MTLTTALSSRTARTRWPTQRRRCRTLIQNNAKPVVITGSQKSIFNQDTDARENLRDAFLYACDDGACGVHIVFDHKVILGTRARKMRTKSYNAFSSIDYPETAILRGRQVVYYIPEHVTGAPEFYDRLDPGVFVLKLIPGIDARPFSTTSRPITARS